ncbi:MAG: bifunctional isocitrate dehydrogenase kinase/phosphatase [Alphaproteobacteria bacterium]|nr:bifunctional isocitrate dehydrogenase kinase/phosphatase [Alphaproteobacteria bacterium]
MTFQQRRDFGTLKTEQIAYAGLAEVEAARSEVEAADAMAGLMLAIFQDYYQRSRAIPWLAKEAFEQRDWQAAVALSQERIAIYSIAVAKTCSILRLVIQERRTGGFWPLVERCYGELAGDLYQADLAQAFLSSVQRTVFEDVWTPVGYDEIGGQRPLAKPDFVETLEADGSMTPALVAKLLEAPALEAPFRDLEDDCQTVAERINLELDLPGSGRLTRIEVVSAGFYRNRGAYVVGALHRKVGDEDIRSPLSLALLHGENGVHVDAVILRETTLRHVFSSTLANFHVTIGAYHELVDFLYRLMPTRPRGMHYSTVGYNHVGKGAVMAQVLTPDQGVDEVLDHAPGPRGSVAIGFTSPSRHYVLKVIRDEPTASYKWDRFDGIEGVLDKYRLVHELNRAGAMLDNIIYSNAPLPVSMFADELLDDLMTEAESSVSRHRDQIFFKHLIIQRKLIPVPLYLERCSPEAAELVTIRLGQCIRNNAATNVFNKDLDGRNYGVTTLRFVNLFDYDAIEPLTEVKVRTNTDREDGEEDIPDWFFEEGTIFLPEELELHLRLKDQALRRLFREAHGELFTADYWWQMQERLQAGSVPRVRTYPRDTQLRLVR